MLTVSKVDVFIQSSHILRGVSLEVGAREVVCLVGRNGSGKTTTLKTIMGYLRPRAGSVEFRGEPIHGRRTHEIAMRGIGWAPEDSGIFADLTVGENVEIATWTRRGGRPAAERIELAYGVFPVLRRYTARKGPQMSGGERKMLSIARALALDPEMLLLDEPTAGMGHEDIDRIAALIKRVAADRTVLMVEHNLSVVENLCHRITVLTRGRVLAEGDYATVSNNPEVREAYMGVGHA